MDIKKYGLTSADAAERLLRDGPNTSGDGKRKGFGKMFLAQFCDLMIIILLVAAALSLTLAIIDGDPSEFAEPIIIVAIVLVNAFLGAYQEFRAERSLESLKKMTSPKTKVVRDGEIRLVDSADLVRGDVCLFEAGDVVTADCKLLVAETVYLNESALTGESVAVEKFALPMSQLNSAKHTNKVFGGSFVTRGRCYGVVSATGQNTELGKIAKLLEQKEQPLTPLQQRLKRLSKLIGVVCLAVCAVVLVTGFVKGVARRGPDDTLAEVFADIFLTSVSLAVAAIPEGLPAVVTVVLARGIENMARQNAVIKRLTAVETLGSATVICSDKTGTLTQNVMTLHGVFDGSEYVSANNIAKVQHLVDFFADCSDVEPGATVGGDPTEVAVCRHASVAKKGIRIYEIPFDSGRKMMTTVVRRDGTTYVVTKGSPDAMKTARNYAKFADSYKLYSRRGFRVLALSVKKIGANFPRSLLLESDFDIVGLFVIADPPRPEAYDAVATCRNAGIRPVMITGDSAATAAEIASTLGVMQQGDMVVDGETLAAMSDEQLHDKIADIAVFARVTPADKLRIVEAWQSRGAVVAMTGDGVNDAPALQRADIGCAMGSGTEVAKDAADMILADDNFATVVKAVALGRSVYQNIKKAVTYLLTCNVGEVLCVFFALLLFDVSPLSAMQLLWVNLVTDGLPGLALGIYKPESDVMSRPPKGKEQSFFSGGGGRKVIVGGVLFGAATLVGFMLGQANSYLHASTMAFLVLSMSQLFFALELRSGKGIFDRDCTVFMVVSMLVSFGLVAVVAFVPPLANLFGLTLLAPWQYAVCLALSLVPTIFYRLGAVVSQKRQKRRYAGTSIKTKLLSAKQ